MYEVPGSDIKQVIVDEDVIRNNVTPTFVRAVDPKDLEYGSDKSESTSVDTQETDIDDIIDSSPKV